MSRPRLTFVVPEEAFPEQPSRRSLVESAGLTDVLEGDEAEALERREAGYIELDDYVLSVNIVEEYRRKKAEMPSGMIEHLGGYDYHRVDFNVLLRNYKWARGVEELEIDARIEGGVGNELVQVTDWGPKTEWVPADYKGELKVEAGYDFLGGLLKLVKLTGPTSSADVTFTYTWAPKVGKVRTGGAGDDMEWNFSKAAGEYLDGGRTLMTLLRRPRQVNEMTLVIDGATAWYDLPFTNQDKVEVREQVRIPIRFTQSKPE